MKEKFRVTDEKSGASQIIDLSERFSVDYPGGSLLFEMISETLEDFIRHLNIKTVFFKSVTLEEVFDLIVIESHKKAPPGVNFTYIPDNVRRIKINGLKMRDVSAHEMIRWTSEIAKVTVDYTETSLVVRRIVTV